ncbi:MAG TPA: protein kinase [Terriglobales bacterium]|nr:protein kinase [Terriglobales bacterium]
MTGEILGHYRVFELIGSGGMGEVYRATDDRLGRNVALKLLKPSFAHDSDRLRRFEQEARAAAALNHPNIVAIYDIGVHAGSPFIVSELLEGHTLRQKLISGLLPLRVARDFAIQITQGLAAAHEKKIIHRDLKPENLFITKDNRVKILDFGIAKLTHGEVGEDQSIATMTTQTKSGSVLGTVAYMSPEQLRARAVDHRSDIFSFGAILYEMLTGRRAFVGETEVDTITAVLREEPQEMQLVRQSIPEGYEHIVRHCLEKDPENRFQTARDLEFALTTIPESPTARVAVRTSPVTSAYKRRLPWIALAILLVVAATVVGWRLRPMPNPSYTRLTFERGTVYSARFASGGHNVLYSAAWNGNPIEVYTSASDSAQSRSLGLRSDYLAAVSSSGELALILRATHGSRLDFINGILARAPLAGGAPREIEEDVRWADWSPSGELAVVHHVGGRSRLEFPANHVLYETGGWVSHIRVSPAGDRIAFFDHPALWDDRGSVCVVDLSGNRTVLSGAWESEDGLSWSSRGDEIWFTAAKSGFNRQLWGVSLNGRQRQILAVPGDLTLQDIAADGRVLLSVDNERVAMEWTGKTDSQFQDLSWYDWSVAKDISSDGKWVLFEESSEPSGPNYAVGIRSTDGSPPIRLGEGSAGGLSPDGKWAVAVPLNHPPRLTILPVGPGQSREVLLPALEHIDNGSAHFMPDGKHVIVNGHEPNHPGRTYLADLSGKVTPITPPGVYASLPSFDGKYVVGKAGSDRRITLFGLDGSAPRPVPNLDPGYDVAQWSRDSSALFVHRSGELPLTVYRAEIATGKLTPVRQLVPAYRVGVVSISPVVTNGDGSEFVYSYYQTLSVLYSVSGLN